MGQNQFVESLVEIMLSWMRWLTSWFWNIVNAQGASGGFLNWFQDNWLGLAVTLIVIGAVVDWLIWMIRWRPYWLWLRKRQVIYEEVRPEERRVRREIRQQPRVAQPVWEDGFEDPFAVAGEQNPYARPQTPNMDNDMADWDSTDDPYARQAEKHTEYDPSLYARPTLGDQPREKSLVRRRPVFGERMNQTNVDHGQSN